MTTTNERLASRSLVPTIIQPNQVLNVPTGLRFISGIPARPWFVQLDGPCPFLQILQTNIDGSFDVWNPTENTVSFDWRAHHLHSEEREPLEQVNTVPTPSTVPPPQALCDLGYASQEDLDQEIEDREEADQNLQDQIDDLQAEIDDFSTYMLGAYWLNVLEITESARNQTPTVVITDPDPAALQNAIALALANDVIEVRTNSTYNPITIPAAIALQVRAGQGFTPSISGAGAVRLSNGASKVIIAGFSFPNCSSFGNQNETGAAVTFPTNHCLVDNIIFDKCTFPEVLDGSAVLLSYYWSIGGEYYYTPPSPLYLSKNISFIECIFTKACKNNTEGAALALRGVDHPFVYKCTANGQSYSPGCRGFQFQNCQNIMVHSSEAYGMFGNGEAIKVDTIGSPILVYPTGQVIRCKAHDSIEGIDLDDYAYVSAIDNDCWNNTEEGISVDNDASVNLENNRCWNNLIGILLENGSKTELQNNHSYNNGTNYSILNGYTLPSTNIDGLLVTTDANTGKKQGMIPADMINADQTPEAANNRWRLPPPSSVESALTKIADNQFEPFEPASGAVTPQGTLIYKGPSIWQRLAPGNLGDVLTQAAGPLPAWIAPAGGGLNLAPTFVVASFDAGDTTSDCTKPTYLHRNGITDGLANAITDAITAGRGTIWIRRGTYQTAASFNISAPIQIIGEGPGITIIEFTNQTPPGYLMQISSTNTALKNLTLYYPLGAVSQLLFINGVNGKCEIHDLIFDAGDTVSFSSSTLRCLNSTYTNILRCQLNPYGRSFASQIFSFLQCSTIMVDRCTCNNRGLSNSLGSIYIYNSEKMTISNNRLIAQATAKGHSIYADINVAKSSLKIVDNICEYGSIKVINFNSSTELLSDLEIVRNKITMGDVLPGDTHAGINFSGAINALIQGNKITYITQTGGVTSWGIYSTGSSNDRTSEVTDNDVTFNTENTAAVNQIGIMVAGYASITGNKIRRLYVVGNNWCFGIASLSRQTIENNQVRLYGNRNIGIDFGGDYYFAAITGNHVVVDGNICKGIRIRNEAYYVTCTANLIEVLSIAPAVQGDAVAIEVQNQNLKINVVANNIWIANANDVGIYYQGAPSTTTSVCDGNCVRKGAGTSLLPIPGTEPANLIYGQNHLT